jgi:hypothetical protein
MTTEQAIATPVTTTEAPVTTVATPEITAAPTLLAGKFTSADELEKAYKNLEKHLGEKRPSAPESYILPDETVSLISKDVLDVAKKANITQEQLKTLTDSLVEQHRSLVSNKSKTEQEILEQNKVQLKKDFGDTLEDRINSIKAVLSQYGDEDTKNSIISKGLLDDAKFVKFIDKMATDVLKSKTVASDFANRGLTPNEAKVTLDQKLGNMEFKTALYNNLHPNHAYVLEEYTRLINAQAGVTKG